MTLLLYVLAFVLGASLETGEILTISFDEYLARVTAVENALSAWVDAGQLTSTTPDPAAGLSSAQILKELFQTLESPQRVSMTVHEVSPKLPPSTDRYRIVQMINAVEKNADATQLAPEVVNLRNKYRLLRTELQRLADASELEKSKQSEEYTKKRKHLAQILSRSQFRFERKSPLSRVWSWIYERIFWTLDAGLRFLSRHPVLDSIFRVLGDALKWTAVIILAILAVLMAMRYRNRPPRLPETPKAPPVSLKTDEPGVYRRIAMQAASEHLFRDALRASYLMVLSQLERWAVVEYDRSRTNWEYLRALRQHVHDTEAENKMAVLNDLYDRKWYGVEACSLSEWQDFNNDAEEFLRALCASVAKKD